MITVTAPIWLWSGGKGSWHFLTVPPNRRSKSACISKTEPRRGFGSVRVAATINGVTWRTSIFPQKSGGYILPIKAEVRRQASIAAGDVIRCRSTSSNSDSLALGEQLFTRSAMEGSRHEKGVADCRPSGDFRDAAAVSPDQSERNQKNAAAVLAAYPPEALARGEQGVVGFRIALDARGRMKSCVVTASSGYPLLDRATCDLMVTTPFRRAATEGNKRGSVHNGALLWQPPTKVAVAPPRVRTHPRRARGGSVDLRARCQNRFNARRTSVCLTAADWGRARYYARRELLRMTIEGGAG